MLKRIWILFWIGPIGINNVLILTSKAGIWKYPWNI